ncbi:MAG: protein translocase subunit SecE [Gammaproteobacteria bacterium]|nr:preprotein translocase subunit SecE [Gammaproteobacteria bacterium]GIS86286.1 MAG: protein translocase subunit SecE [Woeseia sp.]GIT36544.1 MAG: protein translocase subunit SecE [Gammaproteobacteria bacterium]
MTELSNKEISSTLDTLKMASAVAILLSSVFSFYYFAELSVLIRVLVVIFSVILSLMIFFSTQRGIIFWDFIQGSRVEMRKVVWPTKQETIQTTLTVFMFVLVLGIFFWLLDFLLLYITTSITS